jgi:hypothetical protein
MNDVVTARAPRPKTISAAEMQRRRKIVRQADAQNRLEGIARRPESDAVFEAYIRGEIEATEIITRLQALPTSHQSIVTETGIVEPAVIAS